eukprot:GHUV01036759.1.p1 GENE.GHUV01036759.1~~GHUV01036759.1.p1  ORF type:complete len:498 (+),score=81.20 GHUV01036759.1:186-1679(+)
MQALAHVARISSPCTRLPLQHVNRSLMNTSSASQCGAAMGGSGMGPEAQCFYMGPGTLKIDREQFHGPIRQRVCERMRAALPAEKQGIILLKGGDVESVYSTDGEQLFRQEAYFHYMFGVNEDGFWGALDVRNGRGYLFMPRLPESYGVWMGVIQGPQYYKAKYAVDQVCYVDDLASVLSAAAAPCIHVLAGKNTDSGIEIPPLSFPGSDSLNIETDTLFRELNEARVHKTAGEIALMRYVNNVGSRAHVAMMQAACPGAMEYQMESLFRHYTYTHGGCRNQGYTCIAASGPNGAVLHYGHGGAPNDRQMSDGDLLLFDMGCEYYRYGSDITCSWPVNGRFTKDQALIYTAVLDAHSSVIAAMKPGVSWPDMHTLAYRRILSGLKMGGLLQGDVDGMIAADIGGLFMPHGLGHLIGIDTHDVGGYGVGFPPRIQRPGYKSLRTARVLEEGMIITVEPGCYFNPVLLLPALEVTHSCQYGSSLGLRSRCLISTIGAFG